MSAHTPGPWIINPRVSTNVVDLNGRGICSTGGYSTNLIPQDLLTEQNDANARLIAAAPDLLAAANHLFVCDFPDEVDFRCEGCNKARAAIAKAEGKP